MKSLKEFDIDLIGLKLGKHEFILNIADSFFSGFEHSIVEQGKLTVNLELDKQETFISLKYVVEGSIRLICDRSAEPFDYPLSIQETILLKYGDEPQELDDNLEIIAYGTQRFNVGRHIFEMITVAVPLKKLHPRFSEEDEEEGSGLVYTSEEPEEKIEDKEEMDPRWKELLKLKNRKN